MSHESIRKQLAALSREPADSMRRHLTFRRLPPALVCLVLLTGAAPATAPGATASTAPPSTRVASPCVSVPGVVDVACPDPATDEAKSEPKKAKKAKKSGACADATLRPDGVKAARLEAATLCLVNRERTKHRLVPLSRQITLDVVAGRFAKRLVDEQFFDHTAPDGTTMLERIKATSYLKGGLRRWSVGENIAFGTGNLGTPKAIVDAWMRSAGHRANILDHSFREIGLGVHLGSPDGPDGATYVHDFGQRTR